MNTIQEITIFGQALFIGASFLAPKLLAEEDHIQIDLNYSLDTFKARWHKVNSLVRFLMFFPLALFAVTPAAWLGKQWILALFLAAASGALNLAFHWLVFDKELNRLRGLAPDYIGQNAGTDRFLAKHPKAKPAAMIAAILIYLPLFMFLLKNLE